jgi:hypothetical protein
VSEIKDVVKWLKQVHQDNADAANNKVVKRWSTSDYPNYTDMLKEVADTDDLSEELADMLQEAFDGSGGRDYGEINVKELSLQVVNAVKGSLRRKFVHDKTDKEFASINFQRYSVNERLEAIAILERLDRWVDETTSGKFDIASPIT